MPKKRKDWKMPDNKLLHATLVRLKNKGILLIGKSGSGKSDLALRLIENYGAELVADDVVVAEKKENAIYGHAAENLRGLLEVRGIGIISYPYIAETKIDMVVNPVDNTEKIARLPQVQKESILGLEIKKIDLYAKESSAAAKIMAALRLYGEI